MRRAIGTLAGSLVAAAACSSSQAVQTRTLTVHAPAQCAPSQQPFAVFDPLGDFQPPGALDSLPLAETGTVLAGFPSATREIVVNVTDAADALWEAHAVLAPSGNVELLALPTGVPCALTDAISARTKVSLGAVDEAHALIVGGATVSGTVPTTALVDLARGTVSTLSVGLLVPRTEATVTPWRGGAVVAGGAAPGAGGAAGAALDTFEVYSSSAGDFEGTKLSLSQPRARHGAAVMVSGETLLVGGIDGSGNVLASLEAIDASAGRARTGGLGSLTVPRADPIVLRLASGEILVAGGVDATGASVPTLEWFAADGSASTKAPQALVSSLHEAFVPLAAGGALAVIAPDAPSAGFENVWVISADGGLEAATAVDDLSDVSLFAGTAQAPLLWTGNRWLAWQPWSGSFAPFTAAIGAAGPTGDPIASPEPGLGIWFDGALVHALRFGTRGPYATSPTSSSLLAADLAPDRLVLAGVDGPESFEAGVLTLQPGASAFVTDATFASFALDAETPGKVPPAIVLRDDTGTETVLGASACPIAPGATVHYERDGDAMRASVDGGALVTCTSAPAAGARVAIGFRGAGTGASSAQAIGAIVITRT